MAGDCLSTSRRTLALGALLLLALPAAASGTPRPYSVTQTVQVRSSGTTTKTLSCPGRQALALAGAVESAGTGAVPRDSVPRDARRWSFRFTTLGGASNRRARITLRCVGVRIAPGTRDVNMRVFTGLQAVTVPALSSRRVRVRCRSGFRPTGYGIDRAFRGTGDALPAADLRVVSAVPSSGSWVFRLENAGGSDTVAAMRVRCLERSATARRGGEAIRQTFALRRADFSDVVGRGDDERVSHSCPSGHFSLGVGHSLRQNDDIFTRLAYPRGSRSARWHFDHQTGAGQRARTHIVCLSLGTRFR